MSRRLGMQQVLDRFLPHYRQHHGLNTQQLKVCSSIRVCRTAALGGQMVRCEHCGFEQARYHSCRNRHCPQCQSRATQQWCERQLQHVLSVDYFHLVFTLPHELNAWVQWHAQEIYTLLFRCTWETLKCFAADPKRLNGELGMTVVLHSWGQNLSRHVHLHCLVPGGAFNATTGQWHSARSTYLFPVRALSRVFRATLVSALRQAYKNHQLNNLSPEHVDLTLNRLMAKDWVVYNKPTLHHAQTVVKYLSRYTHKIAISNQRIQAMDDEQVRFHWHDYRDHKDKLLTLSGEEFIRRFLMHVLPKGFMRIRHYGFLANRCRQAKLNLIRQAIQQLKVEKTKETKRLPVAPTAQCPCPKCRKGTLRVQYEILPQRLAGG
jgi:hypothetical protein